MDQIEQACRESIDCYRDLLEVYARIREKVASGAGVAAQDAVIEQMAELMRRVQAADIRIQEQSPGGFGGRSEMPLFTEWRELLGRAREENRRMQRHLHAAMAVIQEDRRRLKQGKQALSGYRSGQDRRGRKIDHFSA